MMDDDLLTAVLYITLALVPCCLLFSAALIRSVGSFRFFFAIIS
jgi:hypothetical protein